MKKIKEKEIKEAGVYDPGDTVPPRGIEPDGDDPLLAVKFLEQNNLGPDDTVVQMFTPDEKQELLKLIKKGEFSPLEAAVIRMLMSEAARIEEVKQMSDLQKEVASKSIHIGEPATLDDVGIVIGASSRRSGGKPVSKVAALKEVNRIGAIIARRSKAKYGKEIDFKSIPKFKREMEKVAAWRKKKIRDAERYANAQEREFHKLLAELHRTQDEYHTNPTPEQRNYYVRKFAPSDKDISKMKRFGGTPDERD